MLSKPVTSLDEINKILQGVNRPQRDELDKKALNTLLSGFRVIVDCLENNASAVNLEVAIQWLRLYLKVHMTISSSDTKLNYFLKTVPIAITYIIGWLQNAPSDDINFYKEVLNMSFKLVSLADISVLKKLESDGKGIILLLWNVIDRVGQYDIQIKVLELFISILRDLDVNFAFEEVKNISNIKSDELIHKILDLLRTRKDEYLFKRLARSILNQYNSQRNIDGGVQSFYCKKLEIGKGYKFTKPTYSDIFWFDMNKNHNTLSFEGRIAPTYSRKYQSVNVSLKIKEMFVESNYLNIKFTPPAEVSGVTLENEHFNEVDIARILMTKTELCRFVELYDVPKKPLKSSVEILSVVDLTPKLTLSKKKGQSTLAKKPIRHTKDFSRKDESSDTITRMSLVNSPIPTVSPIIETIKQIQQVKPLSPIFKNNITSKEHKSDLVMLDEYEDIDVSDAEPCQSYKSFTKRKCPTISDALPTKVAQKRSYKTVDLTDEYSKPNKVQNEFNVWDYGPSTSKMALKRYELRKCTLPENEFDKLKSDTVSKKPSCSFENNIVNIINDSSYLQSETPDSISIDSPVNSKENEMDFFNLKTPESKNYLELPSIPITKKVVTALTSYEPSQALVPYEKRREDCLLYQKRSDNDSSSNNSDSEKCGTPKRKFTNTQRSTAKKRLFGLSRANISDTDSDSDYDVTEFIYVAKSDCHKKMQKVKTSLSSFFQQRKSVPIFRGTNRNVRILNDIQDIVKYIQP